MNDPSELIFIFACIEANVVLELGNKQDYEVSVFGKPIELMVSNIACISEYALKSDSDGYFEISFFPDDYLQTMREAETRIKNQHETDLIFPIRHRKMNTTFSLSLTKRKEEWGKITKEEVGNLTEVMLGALIETANKFINGYRLVAGDIYVKNLADDNCRRFFFARSSTEQIVSTSKNPYFWRSASWNDESEIKFDTFLKSEKEPDYPLDRVLLDALNLKNEGNLTVSFIVLVTALEIIVYEIYRRRLLAMNVPEDHVKKVLGYRFSDLIKKQDFYQILGENEKKFLDEAYLNKIGQAYKARNGIVHGGEKIQDSQLTDFWNDIFKFIDFFSIKVGDLFFEPPKNFWGKQDETIDRLVVDLVNTWKEIMARVPDGFYAFSARLASEKESHYSITVKREVFIETIAKFLASKWPEKPLELIVYSVSTDGVVVPIVGFGKKGKEWIPPEEIALNLKNAFKIEE